MAGPPPVFAADELEANKHVRASLVSLIRSGGALLFAGAGFSVPAGYPSWEGLLKERRVQRPMGRRTRIELTMSLTRIRRPFG